MIETIKMDDDKFRLSCSLFELLEIWSMRQAKVDLVYINDKGDKTESHGVISDVYSRNGLEQIEFDKTINIPTRNIISINDTKFKEYMK
jgi:hypothetical protein